jgi:hypothetical protein
MHRRIMSKGAVAGLLLATACLAAAPAARALEDEIIVINEVLGDPASDWDGDGTVDAKGDEWIEVVNVSAEPVNLGDWWLKDLAGDDPDLRLAGVIDPGEALVFYGSAAMAWQASQGLTTAGFGLNNSGDVVQLYRTVAGTGDLDLMYAVSYDDHEAEDDRSCGWNHDFSDWVLFDGINPYGGALDPVGTGCSPTPGWTDACTTSVPTRPATFGGLKAIYR